MAQPADVSPVPSSRRRELGSDSARSLLLTVLGEFVHPRGEPVWTSTLLHALGRLGVEEKSARQAVARAAAEGLLRSERVGRRVRWALTGPGSALLADGTERIYSFQREVAPWDGRWLVLSVAIPESQRQLRHRLRTRLTWLGMGSPAPGLWVVPDAGRAGAAADAVAEAGLGDRAFAWVGTDAPALGDRAALLRAAWDLDAVETRYTTFLAAFTDRRAGTDDEAFVAQVQLVQAWRRFPFLDPGLPAELLDHTWPGLDAAAAFHRLHAEWSAPAQRCWQGLG
ncbi:PaaX family transcriptional regulator [Rhodococcus antarcticus]|uniref:PaaX family transcriptional regulator n=1 Tax=Rhodococcus antarcticus TaxID=2987751 RepID=A0ABY6P0E6_9NOCA|nr:PaaX family transcriptional regulator C-terminal domain-containing protein [Rhodococcus antarcticus]UZJ25117.1 PaaX family transcriptional regulator [Rhodococcus antarcticus]